MPILLELHLTNLNKILIEIGFCFKCSSLTGVVSLAGCAVSIYTFFSSPVLASGIAVTSFVFSQIWVNTRNRGGYVLDRALLERNEDEIIRHLSLGSNIYQQVGIEGGAAPDLLPISNWYTIFS